MTAEKRTVYVRWLGDPADYEPSMVEIHATLAGAKAQAEKEAWPEDTARGWCRCERKGGSPTWRLGDGSHHIEEWEVTP